MLFQSIYIHPNIIHHNNNFKNISLTISQMLFYIVMYCSVFFARKSSFLYQKILDAVEYKEHNSVITVVKLILIFKSCYSTINFSAI